MPNKLKPGDPAPHTGPYRVISPGGKPTPEVVHIHHPGKPMPPTPKPNETFKKK